MGFADMNPGLLLTDDEYARLEKTANTKQWNAVCEAVKAARGGCYPEDWYERVRDSGLDAEKAKQFELETLQSR